VGQRDRGAGGERVIEPDPHRARDQGVDPAQRPGQRRIARLELGERGGGRKLVLLDEEPVIAVFTAPR
jgi:hypothetical protein